MALLTWTNTSKATPSVGQERTVTRFILIPRNLGGEVRWLGRERIVQRYREYTEHLIGTELSYQNFKWFDWKWAE